MIVYYDTGLRNSQQRLWDELKFSWRATFNSNLHPHLLERRPEDGPHDINELQSKWLACASRKILRVVVPQHSLLPLPLPLRRRFH